jgi:hypothetical protein
MQEVGGSIPPGSTSLRWLRQLRLSKLSCRDGCRVVARRANFNDEQWAFAFEKFLKSFRPRICEETAMMI